ncbi:hypothetical protein [Chroococcidiopsis sp. TS-821]|uniref:hypothetical protein n=1 Tax=Chroococcidiopsis sp. TS-821 TaxID=1378066 RepID=UPI000CEE550D|nr:hypothetical protein [Chroococcidiopsis sp. TS-821]PPS44833.1 hypothetical protein B1A85_00650 [Chroococcidiopsis sp. TS-821]
MRSFIVGYLTLPAAFCNSITGGALLVAAYKLFRTHHTITAKSQAIGLLAALICGSIPCIYPCQLSCWMTQTAVTRRTITCKHNSAN